MSRRVSILVILGAFLLGAIAIDGAVDDEPEVVEDTVDRTEFPIATAADSLSSTWYCAGGTAEGEDPFANHIIDILNPTDGRIQVTLTAYGGEIAPPPAAPDDEADEADEKKDSDKTTTTKANEPADAPEPVVQDFELAARSRQQVELSDLVTADVASALIEGSGGLIVEHEIVSEHGRDAKPCSTSASDSWHFAWGRTSADARELLVFFNPFPDDAIIEGVFSTDAGIREPLRFAGLVVPARGTLAVDLGDDVTRREEVAATITARSGRVIVDRIQLVNGDAGRGLTVQTGIPEPQTQWVFPYGFSSDAIREQYSVYNPTDELAEVEFENVFADPDKNGGAEPIHLSIPPGSHVQFNPAADDRIPDSVAHRSIIRSANGVPIVAERVQYASGDSRRGISVTTGSPVEATTWYFAAGSTSESNDEWLNIVNLDTQALTEVSVKAVSDGRLVDVSELQNVEIGPSGRLDVRLGDHISREELSIIVISTEPVVVERGMYRVSGRGVSNSVGVPAPDGLRIPLNPFEADGEVDVDLGELEDAPTVGDDPDDPPAAPDDVELPEPDETIVIENPDAEADITTTTAQPDNDSAGNDSAGNDSAGNEPANKDSG